jgi:hypothetical protein
MQTTIDVTPDYKEINVDLSQICSALFNIAQRYTPSTSFAETNELIRIAKILETAGVAVKPAARFCAAISDHSTNVTRQSSEYRLLKARYAACLSTIADLAGRKPFKTKSAFHEGIHEGLRRAAKIAIMFLDDIVENRPLEPQNSKLKKSDFVR